MPREKEVKSILNKHKKRDSWFHTDYSVNLYEGCSCNCLYCYIRGSKYGENMDHGFAIKTNALEILERQLIARAKKGQFGFVAVGSATDSYMRIEKEALLTRKTLQLLLRYKFPVFISTKTDLILRDIDILKEIDQLAITPVDLAPNLKHGVILSVSISTLDENVSRILEPGAQSPAARLSTLHSLRKEGFFAGVNALPLLPYLSDSDDSLENIVQQSQRNDANYILFGGLTLFGQNTADSRPLYFRFLKRHYPELLAKYENLYGDNYYPAKSYALDLKRRADLMAARYGMKTSILSNV